MGSWTTGSDPQWQQPAPADAGPPRRVTPLTVGDILDGMFRLLLSNWRVYLIALGVLVIPFNIVAGWMSSETVGGFGFWMDMARNPMGTSATAPPSPPSGAMGGGFFLVQFLSVLVVTPLTWGLAGHLAVGAYERRELTAGGVWRAAWQRFWAMLGLMVLLYLIFIAASIVSAILVAVLAFAGSGEVIAVVGIVVVAALLFFAVKLSLAIPALVAERAGPGTALARSWRLVRGRFWRTLGVVLLMFLILTVVTVIFVAGFALVGAIFGTAGALVAGVLGAFVVGMVTTPLLFNGLTLLYFDSRIRGEAYDLDVMTSQVAPYPQPKQYPPPGQYSPPGQNPQSGQYSPPGQNPQSGEWPPPEPPLG